MRSGLPITIVVVGVVAAVAVIALQERTHSTQLYSESYSQDNVAFTNYIAKYGKNYNTKEEYEFRLEQFNANLAKNSQHNQ